MKVKTTEEFIEKTKQVHGDKYDYSKVEYKNTNTKVCIICPEHGEFRQTPKRHLTGQGCPFCGRIKAAKARKHYIPERKWTYEACFAEAQRFSIKADFRETNLSAYQAAYKNGWLEEYTWLEQQFLWTDETALAESRKYQYWTDFIKQSPGAYAFVKTHSLKEQITWLGGKRKPNGYWQDYDNCYNEARKHTEYNSFARKSGCAYESALKNGWINDYTWLKRGRTNKENESSDTSPIPQPVL